MSPTLSSGQSMDESVWGSGVDESHSDDSVTKAVSHAVYRARLCVGEDDQAARK